MCLLFVVVFKHPQDRYVVASVFALDSRGKGLTEAKQEVTTGTPRTAVSSLLHVTTYDANHTIIQASLGVSVVHMHEREHCWDQLSYILLLFAVLLCAD